MARAFNRARPPEPYCFAKKPAKPRDGFRHVHVLLYCTRPTVRHSRWLGQKLAPVWAGRFHCGLPASDAPLVNLPGHRRDELFCQNQPWARLCPSHRCLPAERLVGGHVQYRITAGGPGLLARVGRFAQSYQ